MFLQIIHVQLPVPTLEYLSVVCMHAYIITSNTFERLSLSYEILKVVCLEASQMSKSFINYSLHNRPVNCSYFI